MFVFWFHNFQQNFANDRNESLVESFYSVNYGLSIIMSNVCQIISVMKTKILVFPEKWYSKIVHFVILIHVLSWNIYFTEKKHQQLFDRKIEVTLFDGVEVLDSCRYIGI